MFVTTLIMLALGIALVIQSNRDYADNGHRSRAFARGLGITYLVLSGLAIIFSIIMFARGYKPSFSMGWNK